MFAVADGAIMVSQEPSRAVAVCATIDPFNRVADVSSDLRWHESELFDFDLNDFGARRLCHVDKKERADHSSGD